MFPQNRPPAHLQAPSAASGAPVAASAIPATPQSLKLTYPETLDRIKEEFQFLQNQYHSLKLECEKLATEKTEIQRHYVMYYEMSYGLNIEMHKQTEIAKRLNVICAQLIPFLSQEHQQQVVQAVERAKQVTMTDLNVAIGHQLQTQHLSHHAPPIPLTPHSSGLQPPGLASLGGASGLLALSGALGAQAQLLAKDDRGGHDAEHRGEGLRSCLGGGTAPRAPSTPPCQRPIPGRGAAAARGTAVSLPFCLVLPPLAVTVETERDPGPSSLALPNGERARTISEYLSSSKKRKAEDKDFINDYGSDADKSEDNLVVDEDPSSPHSVHSYSSRENGAEKVPLGRKEAIPLSPTSMASSSSMSPSRSRDVPVVEKAGTPSLKPSTPTSQDAALGTGNSAPQFRPTAAKALDPLALGLRTPLGVQSPYSAAFSMAHPAVNGDVAGSSAYASLHLVSPQLNGAAGAGSYGRSPLVGYDPHPHMRVPGLAASMQVGTSGKPTGTTTSAPASCSLTAAASSSGERPAPCPSGTWLPPRPASRLSSPPPHLPAMPWPSAPMPRSASPAAVMATSWCGTCRTRPWSGSFKVTQMVQAASISPMMVPSCGQGAWTTLCDAGTCGKGVSCSSMTSARREVVCEHREG
ncbi:transducin-like enhancer protein 1 isoform X10 [Rhea pennata]|uniref:transducin-like enhancer protein 1 isoform X10 n=1 Tax=Rhea pennata TaxID=8795 RepID=UPI002E25DE7A